MALAGLKNQSDEKQKKDLPGYWPDARRWCRKLFRFPSRDSARCQTSGSSRSSRPAEVSHLPHTLPFWSRAWSCKVHTRKVKSMNWKVSFSIYMMRLAPVFLQSKRDGKVLTGSSEGWVLLSKRGGILPHFAWARAWACQTVHRRRRRRTEISNLGKPSGRSKWLEPSHRTLPCPEKHKTFLSHNQFWISFQKRLKDV